MAYFILEDIRGDIRGENLHISLKLIMNIFLDFSLLGLFQLMFASQSEGFFINLETRPIRI